MIDLSKPIFNNMSWTEINDTPHFDACHSTDARICTDVVARLQLQWGDTVLVPCTGYGEYLYPLEGVSAHVISVEIDEHAWVNQPVTTNGNSVNMDFMDYDVYKNFDAIILNPPRVGRLTDGTRPYVKIVRKAIENLKQHGQLVLHLHPSYKKGKDLRELHEYIDSNYKLVETLNYYCDEYTIADINIYRKL